MKLNDKVYNFLKWFLIIFVPSFINLVTSLGEIYHFNSEPLIMTITQISTFLGAITFISSRKYYSELGDVSEDLEENNTIEETEEQEIEEIKESQEIKDYKANIENMINDMTHKIDNVNSNHTSLSMHDINQHLK